MGNTRSITQNDIKIMQCMYDIDTGKGLSLSKAISIKDISAKANFVSEGKIRSTIRLLLELGFIDYGIKNGKKNTYLVKPEGLNYIELIKKSTIDVIEEE